MKNCKKNNDIFGKVFWIIIAIVLALYSLSVIATLLWGFLTSLKSQVDFVVYKNVLKLPSLEWSKEEFLHLKNYVMIFKDFKVNEEISYFVGDRAVGRETTTGLMGMFINSFIYAGLGAVLATLSPTIVAYMCAKYTNKFSKFIYMLVIVIMTIPIVGNQASMITVLRRLNLYDNYFGILCMKFSFMNMYFLVLFGFFQSLPDAYVEAAEIDGGTQFIILIKIILPLAIKMMTTIFLIQFVQKWNDYQTALLYMPTHPTLSYGVFKLSIGTNKGTFGFIPAKTAACMLLALPILVIFIAFRDKLMGNMSLGGIKG